MGLWVAEAAGVIPRSAVTDGRFVVFITALLIYAARGTPTPDSIGVAEIIIALLLIVAVGPAGLLAALQPVLPRGPQAGWLRAGQILMLYGGERTLVDGACAG